MILELVKTELLSIKIAVTTIPLSSKVSVESLSEVVVLLLSEVFLLRVIIWPLEGISDLFTYWF